MSSSATRSTNPLSRSRPTTPLRPSSRSSFRSSRGAQSTNNELPPLEQFEPQFAEFSDSMASLEANMMDLQLMHESLARFSESFASFLYGLNMNAYCVDFPEAPIPESFKRSRNQEESSMMQQSSTAESLQNMNIPDNETTFMTTDTEFVENPPLSSRSSAPKFATPKAKPASRIAGPGRGRGIPVSMGRARGGSGLPSVRGKGKGVK